VIVWRISNYASLDGEGGMFASGRWHKAKRRIVYMSDHPASALLELLVHLGPDSQPKSCQLLKINLPDGINIHKTANLPKDWQNHSSVTRIIGSQWLDNCHSAVFKVPSAIVPEASNFLLNPVHSEAIHIKIETVQIIPLDARLK
jgi:RES domain-containing protein